MLTYTYTIYILPYRAYAEGHLCEQSQETAYISYNCDLCFTSPVYKYSYSYDCSVPGTNTHHFYTLLSIFCG